MANHNKQEAGEFLFSLFILLTISYSSMAAYFYINGSIELIFTALSALLIIIIAIALEEHLLSKALISFARKLKLKS